MSLFLRFPKLRALATWRETNPDRKKIFRAKHVLSTVEGSAKHALSKVEGVTKLELKKRVGKVGPLRA